MAVVFDAFRRYYAPDGPAWAYERQALVQLRPVAGDAGLGQEIEALRDQYVYNGDPFDVTAMRGMRNASYGTWSLVGPSMPSTAPAGWSMWNT